MHSSGFPYFSCDRLVELTVCARLPYTLTVCLLAQLWTTACLHGQQQCSGLERAGRPVYTESETSRQVVRPDRSLPNIEYRH